MPINSVQKSALSKAGIETLSDLCRATQWELIKIKGIGTTSVENIANWFTEQSLPALTRINISEIGMTEHGAYYKNSNADSGMLSQAFVHRLNTDQDFKWMLPSAIAPNTELFFPLNLRGHIDINLIGNADKYEENNSPEERSERPNKMIDLLPEKNEIPGSQEPDSDNDLI